MSDYDDGWNEGYELGQKRSNKPEENLADITWARIIEEALKNPDDPMSKMFMEVHEEKALLKELCYRIYMDDTLSLREGWILDYKRLMKHD